MDFSADFFKQTTDPDKEQGQQTDPRHCHAARYFRIVRGSEYFSAAVLYGIWSGIYQFDGGKKLFRQINNFTPPIMSIFFIVSGMNLDLRALETVGIIGISYFAVRIVGKYAGTYVGCLLTGSSREMRNYMGLALIPQAGVAIGLAFLGQRLLPTETGNLMLAIILSSSVLYEMIGPISAKLALVFSGSIPFGHTELPEAESREREEKEMLLCPEEGESRGSQSREPQDTNRSIEELMEEMSAGVDERDDDDIEKSVIGESEKEKKKKTKAKTKKKAS